MRYHGSKKKKKKNSFYTVPYAATYRSLVSFLSLSMWFNAGL